MTMDKLLYNMPFAKVDRQRRIVSGFATLNNLDRQKDIVETEASMKAFNNWRGNVREQHSKIAAGKVLSFGIEQFFDKVASKVYDGVFVRAYISKGAPDTWEKVLDGTLNGFSIGGEINEWVDEIDDDGNAIRVIKDYTLSELSLVDNPANQFANITSIEKAHDFFANMAEDIEEKELDNMEKADGPDGTVVVGDPEPVATESGVVNDSAVVAEPAPEAAPEPEPEPAPVALVEVEPVAAESNDSKVLSNAIDEIKTLIDSRDSKTLEAFNAIVEQLKEMRAGIDNATNNTNNMAGELASIKSTVSEFDKRVNAVERDTAVRKSVDLGEVEQERENTVTQKSIWGGRFLTADQ